MRVGFVIDYQNFHLTAHHHFHGNSAKEKSLLHPLNLCHVALKRRSEYFQNEENKLEITQIRVFRGLPSNKRDSKNYARNLSQKSEWTKDPRVEVEYLELKYRDKLGLPPQEKGIDVLTALNFVEMTQSGDFDLVILMSHDTDLVPALKMASRVGHVRVESAGWKGLNKLRIGGEKLFHTFLTFEDFSSSIDLKDYSEKGEIKS